MVAVADAFQACRCDATRQQNKHGHLRPHPLSRPFLPPSQHKPRLSRPVPPASLLHASRLMPACRPDKLCIATLVSMCLAASIPFVTGTYSLSVHRRLCPIPQIQSPLPLACQRSPLGFSESQQSSRFHLLGHAFLIDRALCGQMPIGPLSASTTDRLLLQDMDSLCGMLLRRRKL